MNKKIHSEKTQQSEKKEKPVSPAITNFPSPLLKKPKKTLSNEKKIEIIADRFKDILEVLGLDLKDDSIARTPYRIAKMYVEEIFSGLDEQNFPAISFFKDEFHHEHKANMVLTKVSFTSFCEHHFVPMNGIAYVAYIPEKQLIGLSKIPRVVRFFARRPQVQERLTAQIADCMALLLESNNIAISISAYHYCVIARGIEDEQSHTITNVLRGQFNTNENLRREFFEGINRPAP